MTTETTPQPLTQEGMKVMFCEIQNFKGIKHQVIDFDGKSAWLIGGNGQNKSSVIDAILSATNSEFIPAQPIHGDEVRGSIHVKLKGNRNGREEEYTIDISFTPSNRTGKVKVKDIDGNDLGTSARTIMKDIFGETFDIYEFLTDKVEDQIESLKKLSGVGDNLDAIDVEISEAEAERKALNKEVTEYNNVNKRENRPFTDDDIDAHKNPVDEDAITAKLKAVEEAQGKWQKQQDGVTQTKTIIENNSKDVIRLSTEIEECRKEISVIELNYNSDLARLKKKYEEDMAALGEKAAVDTRNKEVAIERKKESITAFHTANKEYQEKVDKAEAWLKKNPKPTTEAVMEEMKNARKHNETYRIIKTYADRQKEILNKQKLYEEKDEFIKAKRQEKITLISKSQLPVDGLLWSNNSITLNGVPLEQLNTQTKLDLGAKITVAMKKPLRLVMLREGSLYDMPHLKKTLEWLTEQGMQYIVEWVKPEGGPLEIKFEEKDLTAE